jgi:cytochrome c oxidase subunit 2
VATIGLTGCAADVLPEPATEQADKTADLWDTFVPIAIAVWILIWALVGWAVVRYRRRKNDDELPDQRQYFTKLEIGYTIAPVVIVAFLWFVSWQTTDEITTLSDDPDVVVDVIGFQWQWQFRYPEHGVVTEQFVIDGAPGEPPTLVVPVGQTVRFRLTANDVIHSFWVPDFLEKRDLIPEIDNEIEVNVKEPGSWQGRCAEFCGLDHWAMYFTVEAIPVDDFEKWVNEQQNAITVASVPDDDGQSLPDEGPEGDEGEGGPTTSIQITTTTPQGDSGTIATTTTGGGG